MPNVEKRTSLGNGTSDSRRIGRVVNGLVDLDDMEDVIHVIGSKMLLKELGIGTPISNKIEEVTLISHVGWSERSNGDGRRKRLAKDLAHSSFLDLDLVVSGQTNTSSTSVSTRQSVSDDSKIKVGSIDSRHDEDEVQTKEGR